MAGAAAVIQGVRAAKGLPKLTSMEMRDLLASTGVPQSPGVRIGTQPDLRAALRASLPDTGRMSIYGLGAATQPAQPVSGHVTVRNTGPFDWTAATHPTVCRWDGGGPDVNVTQLPQPLSVHGTASMAWTSTTPGAIGPATVTCEHGAVGTPAARGVAGTVVSNGSQLLAQVESFELPTSMPYGRNGDLAEPVPATISIRNAGTQTWSPAQVPVVAAHVEQAPGGAVDAALPGPVAPGERVTFTVDLVCVRPRGMSASVVMTIGGVSFSNTVSDTTFCVGTDH